MSSSVSTSLLVAAVSLVFLLQSALSSDPLYNFCSNSNNYTANSPYSKNLDQVLTSLAIKAPWSGFAMSSAGKYEDKANGLVLCRGDVSSTDCKACINIASNELRQRCPYTKEGIVWYDYCQLRYSSMEFFGTVDNKNKLYLVNTQTVSEPALFIRQLGELMYRLSLDAALVPSMFASGEIEFGNYQKIYGLAQCTRDLSSGACKECLDSAIADIPSCCDGKQGGRVVGGSCNVRYEIYPFFSS